MTYEPETSVALGFGFRCGFLGLLHMEITRERLEREFGLDLISTSPNVVYRVILDAGADDSGLVVTNPSDCSDTHPLGHSQTPLQCDVFTLLTTKSHNLLRS